MGSVCCGNPGQTEGGGSCCCGVHVEGVRCKCCCQKGRGGGCAGHRTDRCSAHAQRTQLGGNSGG